MLVVLVAGVAGLAPKIRAAALALTEALFVVAGAVDRRAAVAKVPAQFADYCIDDVARRSRLETTDPLGPLTGRAEAGPRILVLA